MVNKKKSKPFDSANIEKSVSSWVWFGCILLVIASSLHSADKPLDGGDTWVAMASGRYTLGPWAVNQPHRTWQMHLLDKLGVHITRQDPFSAKSRPYNPDNPKDSGWVNQNWLSHVLFYKMMTVWGGNSLTVLKFTMAVLTGLFTYWAGRVMGAHPVFAATAASYGVLLSRSFFDIRPNGFTILFTAIMILLLGCWNKSRYWALAWMFPLMIIWANMHGGFSYAILVFAIMTGGHLAINFFFSNRPENFVIHRGKGLLFLISVAAIVTAIPAVFSPFGWENLKHPFLIISGAEESNIFRQNSEWHPIWVKNAVGNTTPYLFFLFIFAAVFVSWWILYYKKPRPPKKHITPTNIPWPRIDLAQLAIIGITIAMSIKSRRFIVLSGVVLAPFLARMAQEVLNMVRLKQSFMQKQISSRNLQPVPYQLALPFAWSTLAAGVIMSFIFIWCMWDIYYRPPLIGGNQGVFRRMIGINTQPVRAIKFFDLNKIQGTVFNEWRSGGFVPFWQQPTAKTGEPLCKPYIDGRTQAAYTAEHVLRWYYLISALDPPDQDLKVIAEVNKLAKELNILKEDPKFYEKIVYYAKTNPQVLPVPELNRLVEGDPQFYTKMLQHSLSIFIKNLDLSENDPQLYDKLAKLALKDKKIFRKLAGLSPGNPELFGKLIEYEGVNVVLLSLRKKIPAMSLLERSGNWVRVYIDGKDTIFLLRSDKTNIEILNKPMTQVNYPDDFSKKFSIGYNLAFSDNPKAQHKGMELLMNARPEHYIAMHYKTINTAGMKLQAYDKLNAYFSHQRKDYLVRLEKNKRLGRLENYEALIHISLVLQKLSRISNKPREVEKYTKEIKHYSSLLKNLSIKEKEGWFW